MYVAALVISIVGAATGVAGVVTAVIGIRIARRSAAAAETSAKTATTATEVAQKQLAIERDRHLHELDQRHEDAAPTLEGHVVRPGGNDGAGRPRLEIRVTNSVRLRLVTVILPAGAPIRMHSRTPLAEQWIAYPEAGKAVIEIGRPAHWDVDVLGEPKPFTVLVIAHGDYTTWDRRPVQIVFDA